MKYYYNEQDNSFYISTNFIPMSVPKGYVEITQEQYEELTKPNEEETVANDESI